MRSTTSSKTVNALEEILARFGLPETIVSDIGPQLTSYEFELFCVRNGIQHLLTPTYSPQSNGQAERFVDTFKHFWMKNSRTPQWLNKWLLDYRSTPHKTTGKTPSELMFNRQIRTLHDLLRPNGIVLAEGREGKKVQFNEPDYDYVKPKRRLLAKDKIYVRVQPESDWEAAVIKRYQGSMCVEVQLEDGRLIKKHINDVRKRYAKLPEDETFDDLLTPPSKPSPPRNQEDDQVPPLRRNRQRNRRAIPAALRRSQRVPKPVKFFDPDPRKK
jgi:hypothetical protein